MSKAIHSKQKTKGTAKCLGSPPKQISLSPKTPTPKRQSSSRTRFQMECWGEGFYPVPAQRPLRDWAHLMSFKPLTPTTIL